MGNYDDLPVAAGDLETAYTVGDLADVAVADGDRVCQAGKLQYMIHEFKDFVGDQTAWVVTWIGQSSLAAFTSKVVLQVYDYDASSWVDLDEDTITGADTDITLTGTISTDPDHYKDAGQVITCRIYQMATGL